MVPECAELFGLDLLRTLVTQGRRGRERERNARRLRRPDRGLEQGGELLEPQRRRLGHRAADAGRLLGPEQQVEVLSPEVRGLRLGGGVHLFQPLVARPLLTERFRDREPVTGGFRRAWRLVFVPPERRDDNLAGAGRAVPGGIAVLSRQENRLLLRVPVRLGPLRDGLL